MTSCLQPCRYTDVYQVQALLLLFARHACWLWTLCDKGLKKKLQSAKLRMRTCACVCNSFWCIYTYKCLPLIYFKHVWCMCVRFHFLALHLSMLLTIPWHVFLWLRPNVRRRSMLHNVGRQTYSFGCLFNYKFTIKISCSCRQKNQSDGSKRCATTYLDLEFGWWMSVLLGVKRFIYS